MFNQDELMLIKALAAIKESAQEEAGTQLEAGLTYAMTIMRRVYGQERVEQLLKLASI